MHIPRFSSQLFTIVIVAGCADPEPTAGSASAKASGAPRPSATVAVPPGTSTSVASTAAVTRETPPPPAAPVDAGDLKIPDGPVVLDVGGVKVTYKTAILHAPFGATLDGDKKFYDRVLKLVLSTDDKLTCENGAYGKDYIELELGPGPDGDFYAGKEIATTYFAYAEAFKPVLDSNRVYVKAPFTRLRLGAFKPTDASFDLGLGVAQVQMQKEKQVVIKGGGTVKVQICKDRNKESFDAALANAKIPPAKAGPVAGSIGGKSFQGKTALAVVAHDKVNGVDIVESFTFFASDAKCEDVLKDVFSGGGVQGIGWSAYELPLTSKNRLTGVAIPLSIGGAELVVANGKFKSTSISFDVGRSGWIRIDEASLEDGGVIKGALVADTGPRPSKRQGEAGRLDGTFTAKVCKKK